MFLKPDHVASVQAQMLAQQDNITQLNGDNIPDTVDVLKEEIEKITVTIKLYHYAKGDVWGHLATIIPEEKMAALIGDVGFDRSAPIWQDTYNDALLNTGTEAQ